MTRRVVVDRAGHTLTVVSGGGTVTRLADLSPSATVYYTPGAAGGVVAVSYRLWSDATGRLWSDATSKVWA